MSSAGGGGVDIPRPAITITPAYQPGDPVDVLSADGEVWVLGVTYVGRLRVTGKLITETTDGYLGIWPENHVRPHVEATP